MSTANSGFKAPVYTRIYLRKLDWFPIYDHKLEGTSIGLPYVKDRNYHPDIVIIFKKSCFEEKTIYIF